MKWIADCVPILMIVVVAGVLIFAIGPGLDWVIEKGRQSRQSKSESKPNTIITIYETEDGNVVRITRSDYEPARRIVDGVRPGRMMTSRERLTIRDQILRTTTHDDEPNAPCRYCGTEAAWQVVLDAVTGSEHWVCNPCNRRAAERMIERDGLVDEISFDGEISEPSFSHEVLTVEQMDRARDPIDWSDHSDPPLLDLEPDSTYWKDLERAKSQEAERDSQN